MRAWVAAAVVSGLLAAPAAAGAQGVAGLEFVAPDELSVALEDSAATKSVWVRNSSTTPTQPRFSTLLEDSDGNEKSVAAAPVRPASLGPGQEKRYRLRFSTDEDVDGATGELVVSGAGAPGSLELTVSKKTIVDRGVTEALLLPLLVAVLIVGGAAWLVMRDRETTFGPLPSGIEFDKSFASGITAVGAILGTILTASVLPEETTSLSKEGYAALNLIFGIAIVAAAFVYAALQLPAWTKVKDEPTKEQMELKGGAIGYLVASVITVWAVLGELWLTTRLLGELGSGKGFSSGAKIALGVLLLVAIVLLGLYVYRRLLVVFANVRTAPVVPEKRTRKPEPRTVPKTKYERRRDRSIAAGGPPAVQRQSVPLL